MSTSLPRYPSGGKPARAATLPDLAPPFPIELIFDAERAAGFVVVHRAHRRVLLRRDDGVFLRLYLRHGRTVVRTEKLEWDRADAMERMLRTRDEAPLPEPPTLGRLVGGPPLTLAVLGDHLATAVARRAWSREVQVIRAEGAPTGDGICQRVEACLRRDDELVVAAMFVDRPFGVSDEEVAQLRALAELGSAHRCVIAVRASLGWLGADEEALEGAPDALAEALNGPVMGSLALQAWRSFRREPVARWLGVFVSAEGTDALVAFAGRLHDDWVVGDAAANTDFLDGTRYGASVATTLNDSGFATHRSVAVVEEAVFEPPYGEPHENHNLCATARAARVMRALPSDLEAAQVALGDLVAADETPFGRARIDAVRDTVKLSIQWLADPQHRWVTLSEEAAALRARGERWRDCPIAIGEPGIDATALALGREPRVLLDGLIAARIPEGAAVRPPLGCPEDLWRLDDFDLESGGATDEGVWAAAARSVARGATPELQVVQMRLLGTQLSLTAHVDGSSRARGVYPWDVSHEHAVAKALGRRLAGAAVGRVQLAVYASEPDEGTPSWLLDYGRHLLAEVRPGPRTASSRHVSAAWPGGQVARLVVDADHRACVRRGSSGAAPQAVSVVVLGTDDAHSRLTMVVSRTRDLHLPILSKPQHEDAMVGSKKLRFRRDAQRGRTVRDAAWEIDSRYSLYVVSECDDVAAWKAHRAMLASLVIEQPPPHRRHGSEAQSGARFEDLYEVGEPLGSGGAADVHRVWHRGWAMELALKRPRDDVAHAAPLADTLRNEAEAWTKLGPHPNVVSCFAARRHRRVPHIFIELVEGGTLADWMSDGRLYRADGDSAGFSSPETHRRAAAFARIVDVGIQVAHGLHHAHENGLIHQDIKPANILLTEDGVAKVTDFGLVKASPVKHEVKVHETVVATCGGLTPAFCSPEQAMAMSTGDKLTRRSDIYSWAVVMLAMLNGEVTWRSGPLAAVVLREVVEHGPENAMAPPISPDLAELLLSCLHGQPDARPHDMLEVATALERIHHHTLGSRYTRRAPRAVDGRADVLTNQGASLMDLAEPRAALEAWSEAARIDPLHLHSGYNLALVAHRSGGRHLRERMRDLLDGHADVWEAHIALSWVCVELGDVDEGERALERALALGAPRHEVNAVRRSLTPGLVRVATQRIRHVQRVVLIESTVVALCHRQTPHPVRPWSVVWWSLDGGAVVVDELDLEDVLLCPADGSPAGVWVAGRTSSAPLRDELRHLRCPAFDDSRAREAAPDRPLDLPPGAALTAVAAGRDVVWVGRADGRVAAWSPAHRTCLWDRHVHAGPVRSLSPVDEEGVLTCSDDGTVAVLDERGEVVRHVAAEGVADAACNRRALVLVQSACIRRIDHATRAVGRLPIGGAVRGAVSLGSVSLGSVSQGAVSLDAEGSYALEHDAEGRLSLWNIDEERLVASLTARAVPVDAAGLTRDAEGGLGVVVCHADGQAVVMRLEDTQVAPWLVVRPRPSEAWIDDAEALNDTLRRARDAADNADYMRARTLVDQASRLAEHRRNPELIRLRRVIAPHVPRAPAPRKSLAAVYSSTPWRTVSATADATAALCVDAGGALALFELEANGLRWRDVIHRDAPLRAAALSADGARAVTLTTTGALHHHNLHEQSGEALGRATAFALARDTRDVAVAHGAQEVAIVHLDSGRRRAFGGTEGARCIAMSDDATSLACGFADGSVGLWRVHDGALLWRRRAHDGAVWALAISERGEVLSSATDGIRLLDDPHRGARALANRGAKQLGLAHGVAWWCADPQGPAVLWDVEREVVLHTFEAACDLAVSVDVTRIITCSNTGLRGWELHG